MKQLVANFWESASCGEHLYLRTRSKQDFDYHSTIRYTLEPYILDFAEFSKWSRKKVLEIGVGMGADHAEFCKAGAELTGIDLTQRAINITRERLTSYKLESTLICGDAENLPFQGNSFDLVYSWGVIHHTTDTRKAAQEILRVLKPGGEFRVMVYHKWSLVGLMLWLRYALLRLKPFCSLEKIYATYLESPGTKAYSRAEALQLFSGCSSVETSVVLTHGDLLESQAGQRHKGLALKIARALWPRWLFKLLCRNLGLFLLIKGRK